MISIDLKIPVELLQPIVNMGKLGNKKVIEVYPSGSLVLEQDIYNHEFCFNYALQDNEIGFCEEALEILEAEYNQISDLSHARQGDIVSFHYGKGDDYLNAQHFGVIVNTDGTIEGTIIKSKWGAWGVFKGKLNELPKDYGTCFVIWRKK